MIEPPDVVDLQTGYHGLVLLDERIFLGRFVGDVVVTGEEDYDRFEDFVGDIVHGLQLRIRHGIELSMRYGHQEIIENGLQVGIRGEQFMCLENRNVLGVKASRRELIAINSFCFFCARKKRVLDVS